MSDITKTTDTTRHARSVGFTGAPVLETRGVAYQPLVLEVRWKNDGQVDSFMMFGKRLRKDGTVGDLMQKQEFRPPGARGADKRPELPHWAHELLSSAS